MASKARTRRRGKIREVTNAANSELTAILEPPDSFDDLADLTNISKQKRFHLPWLAFFLDSEDDPTTRVRVFPRLAIFSLMALTFYSRYLFLTGFEGLGMLNPDETFQAIEVAHSEVYGYGFVPDEKPCSGNGTSGRPPPTWIYPGTYVLLFRAREFFGWGVEPFVLARRFHGAVAVMLPFTVYKFARTMFGQSRDIAFMAATLVAFSKHLMLLGIHPFIQSLISPLIFMLLTIVLNIFGVDQVCDTDTPHQESRKLPGLNLAAKFGLLFCGIILGVLLFVHLDSVLLVSSTFIVCLIPSHTSRKDTLPSMRTLVGAIVLLSSFFTGIALGSAQDYAIHGLWCWTPLNTIRSLVSSFSGMPTEASYTMYSSSFISASHVHLAVILAAIIVSVIYSVHHWRLSVIFDGMVSTTDELLFQSTFRITVLSSVMLVFYSCQNQQDIRVVHDVIVLILIAGSAGVYLLYSSLYAYVMSITTPGKTTRNMVKLILYAELFLYMFEARMTFPTAHNRNIAAWAHEQQWESAYINQCLRYVGQQSDVTGVIIDYQIQMTGGFSLLHHNVPIYAKSGLGFREWGAWGKRRVREQVNDLAEDTVTLADSDARVSKLDEVTDFISLLNSDLLVKRAIEKAHYNYVIVSGGRKFFKRGFREVFNASDIRVFKRSKSRTESEYLSSVADKIPIGLNATVLEYEGQWLIALKKYEEAVLRLNTALEINVNETRLKTWKLVIFALKQINHSTDANVAIKRCKDEHGSECEQHLVMGELERHELDSDLRAASYNYKFLT